MPTYEYECTICPWRFDLFQNMNEPPQESCPKCGGVLRRLIGKGAGIIFKGKGFYATDYRKKEEKKKTNSASDCRKCNLNSTCEDKKE
jgi:putative FmdB family regulatory protein